MEKRIIYFEEPGPQNTETTIQAAKERALELGIRHIVVATTHGRTGLKVAEAFKDLDCNIVAVTISQGYEAEGWTMKPQERERLTAKGLKVFTGLHALGDDVNAALAEELGGNAYNAIVAHTLYRFCQGMKVCVEVVLMAADAGLIPIDQEVISIAGTGEGADTAIVVKPSYARKFLDLRIKEIIAKPR
ncbi:MAG: pyruvate kinase alpha/beta domain-containing protein [Candidatus Bathyarchaeia archaeon]